MTDAFPSTIWFALEPQGQATKVDVGVDHSIPGGIIGKIANQLQKELMNRKNVQSTAEELKIFCEA